VPRVEQPSRSSGRFQVVLVGPTGVAQYTTFAVMLSEARRVAEGWVRGKQG
jgi:hypothetical protein